MGVVMPNDGERPQQLKTKISSKRVSSGSDSTTTKPLADSPSTTKSCPKRRLVPTYIKPAEAVVVTTQQPSSNPWEDVDIFWSGTPASPPPSPYWPSPPPPPPPPAAPHEEEILHFCNAVQIVEKHDFISLWDMPPTYNQALWVIPRNNETDRMYDRVLDFKYVQTFLVNELYLAVAVESGWQMTCSFEGLSQVVRYNGTKVEFIDIFWLFGHSTGARTRFLLGEETLRIRFTKEDGSIISEKGYMATLQCYTRFDGILGFQNKKSLPEGEKNPLTESISNLVVEGAASLAEPARDSIYDFLTQTIVLQENESIVWEEKGVTINIARTIAEEDWKVDLFMAERAMFDGIHAEVTTLIGWHWVALSAKERTSIYWDVTDEKRKGWIEEKLYVSLNTARDWIATPMN
jgi:hypothetical protein